MLNNFFRINLPYGFAKNANGEWMAFNREYRPIGYNESSKQDLTGKGYLDLPVYTKYQGLTEEFLIEIADGDDSGAIQRNEKGEIEKVFLYNDRTNPVNQSTNKPELWKNYFTKLQRLSKLEVKDYY